MLSCYLAIKFGVLVEGVVELLWTLLQPQGEGGLGARASRPVLEVLLLKQRAHVFHCG